MDTDTSSGATGLTGLSQNEARARLEAEGANEMPAADRRSIGRLALEIARDPTFVLLLAADRKSTRLNSSHT